MEYLLGYFHRKEYTYSVCCPSWRNGHIYPWVDMYMYVCTHTHRHICIYTYFSVRSLKKTLSIPKKEMDFIFNYG